MKAFVVVILMLTIIPVIVFADDYVPGEVVVSFKDKSEEIFSFNGDTISCVYPGLHTYFLSTNLLSSREIYHGDRGMRNIYVLQFDEEADVESIADDLKNNPEVIDATPNYYLEFLAEPNDWYYNNDWWIPEWWGIPDTVQCLDQWHLQLMQVNKAWDITKGDETTTIAILDTGVDYFHPDLMDNI